MARKGGIVATQASLQFPAKEPTVTLRLRDAQALRRAAERYLQEFQDDGPVRLAFFAVKAEIRRIR